MSSSGDRVPRALRVEPELAALLSSLAGREGRPPSGHVDLDALFAIEVALTHTFNDDLLAALAADLPALRASHGFGLAEIIGHCGRLRDSRLRGDLIGIACDDACEYVLDKRNADAVKTVVCRLERGGGSTISERLSVAEFLVLAAKQVSPSPNPIEPFAASLHRRPPMANTPGRVVVHKVFGRGTAFSEKGDGPNRKVTCDFPGRGLKVIQARFLTFDDGAER